MTISASAQDRNDQNRDHDQQMDQTRDNHANNNDQWENRNGWEYRTYTSNEHPDGWMEGHKTKSSYCEGHNGCYVYQYQGAPYYYYRDENGQMVVRRHHHDHDMNHDHDQK